MEGYGMCAGRYKLVLASSSAQIMWTKGPVHVLCCSMFYTLQDDSCIRYFCLTFWLIFAFIYAALAAEFLQHFFCPQIPGSTGPFIFNMVILAILGTPSRVYKVWNNNNTISIAEVPKEFCKMHYHKNVIILTYQEIYSDRSKELSVTGIIKALHSNVQGSSVI